ncbi:50S ribosomal protein L31 [bacterium]|nr:50S ribosomal protein L31 [bacterium]
MRKKIHPKYYQAKVTCACGSSWTVGSTKKEIQLDLCSACHPFFTGKQKMVDTAGRVEKFRRKYGIVDKTAEAIQKKK